MMRKRGKAGEAKTKKDELAGIEYHGRPGVSHSCQDAVLRLLQDRERVTRVQILSCQAKRNEAGQTFHTDNGGGLITDVTQSSSSDSQNETRSFALEETAHTGADGMELDSYALTADALRQLRLRGGLDGRKARRALARVSPRHTLRHHRSANHGLGHHVLERTRRQPDDRISTP